MTSGAKVGIDVECEGTACFACLTVFFGDYLVSMGFQCQVKLALWCQSCCLCGAEKNLAVKVGGPDNLQHLQYLKGLVDPDNLFKNHQLRGLAPTF